MAKKSQVKFKPQSTSPTEWIVAALGAAVVVATVAYLIYDDLSSGPTHPDISIIEQQIEQTRSGYLLTFRVHNSGHSTAAHLNVVGELIEGDKTVESREVAFDYVPAFSSRRGGLFFTHNPSNAEMRLRPVSFVEP